MMSRVAHLVTGMFLGALFATFAFAFSSGWASHAQTPAPSVESAGRAVVTDAPRRSKIIHRRVMLQATSVVNTLHVLLRAALATHVTAKNYLPSLLTE